jgi:hypothetical protein
MLAVLLTAAGATLVGCAASGGPEPLADGTYRHYASSGTPTADQRDAASLEIRGDEVEVTSGGLAVTRVMGGPTNEVLLCPPSGRGAPRSLGAPLVVAGVEFARPALFGDCALTTPVRVTVVDLDTADDALQFPFVRWAEFCDVTDPDCRAGAGGAR